MASPPLSRPDRATTPHSRRPTLQALRLSYLFYAAQRSGKLPASNPIPWRGDSHVNDCVPGGYYDAGDHLKLHFPLATSLALLAWGVDEFRDAYAAAGQLSTALDAIRWGTDYLMAAHIAPNEFIGQVRGETSAAPAARRPSCLFVGRSGCLLAAGRLRSLPLAASALLEHTLTLPCCGAICAGGRPRS